MLIQFVVNVLVASSMGYALVRLLETTISISARTRQMLFAAVMVLPLTTFAFNIAYGAKACTFSAVCFSQQARLLFTPQGRSIMLLLAGLAVVYAVKSLRFRALRQGKPPVVCHPQQHKRVYRLLAELNAAQPGLLIYRAPYPFACVSGVRRPVILLTSGLLEAMDDQELKAVLAHELAHVKRKDNLLNQALALIRYLTFFSPATHRAYLRYEMAREEAADDLALTMLTQPADLASALVKIIRVSQRPTRWSPPAGAQSSLQSGQALQRAERILSERKISHNPLVERGILLLMTIVMPMLFC